MNRLTGWYKRRSLITTLIMGILLVYKQDYTWPGLVIVLFGIPVYFLWNKRNQQNTR